MMELSPNMPFAWIGSASLAPCCSSRVFSHSNVLSSFSVVYSFCTFSQSEANSFDHGRKPVTKSNAGISVRLPCLDYSLFCFAQHSFILITSEMRNVNLSQYSSLKEVKNGSGRCLIRLSFPFLHTTLLGLLWSLAQVPFRQLNSLGV